MKNASLIKALEIVGGPVELARRLNISSQAISQWDRVPANRVIAVEDVTHGAVSRSDLRPDLYPPHELRPEGVDRPEVLPRAAAPRAARPRKGAASSAQEGRAA